MKFLNITLLFVIIALACHLSLSMAEDTKRPALRRPVGKGGKPSTTTTTAPAEEEEGDYNENGEENQYGDEGEDAEHHASTTTTTTEPPKRIGPVIRPFRSNDDFLNSLKRRQMNAKKGKAEKPAPKAKPAAAAEEDDGNNEAAAAPAPAPAAKGGFSKPSSALNRRKLSKPSKPEPAEEPAEEQADADQKEDPKAKRPLARLALRKRN